MQKEIVSGSLLSLWKLKYWLLYLYLLPPAPLFYKKMMFEAVPQTLICDGLELFVLLYISSYIWFILAAYYLHTLVVLYVYTVVQSTHIAHPYCSFVLTNGSSGKLTFMNRVDQSQLWFFGIWTTIWTLIAACWKRPFEGKGTW